MSSRIPMIDLFAGCGGLTAGFHQTKQFETVHAVEIDEHAAMTYTRNFDTGWTTRTWDEPGLVFTGDIADWVGMSKKSASVVVGGPPCQGFSALGKRDPDDPRNKLWRHYVEVLEQVRPAYFVIENVPQFLKSVEFKSLQGLVRGGRDLDRYELQVETLLASDFGAAQRRRRAVVIGRRKGSRPVDLGPITEPKPLRAVIPAWMDEPVLDVDLPEGRTMMSAGLTAPGPFTLRELHITRDPTPLSMERYRHIPAGGNRSHLPDHLKAPCWRKHTTGSSDVMGRLRWDRPSVTIRTEFFKPEKGRYLHPDQHRPITHAEAALIQGFPEDFVWCGTKTSIARQIGNAVPVPLARRIGETLAGLIG